MAQLSASTAPSGVTSAGTAVAFERGRGRGSPTSAAVRGMASTRDVDERCLSAPATRSASDGKTCSPGA